MRKGKFVIVVLVIAQIMVSIVDVLSFGVSSPYCSDCTTPRHLYVKTGQTKEFNLTLSNINGNEDIEVLAEIVKGDEIVKFPKKIILRKGEVKKIPVKISIPLEAYNMYEVSILFKQVSKGSGIQMSIGARIQLRVFTNGKKIQFSDSTEEDTPKKETISAEKEKKIYVHERKLDKKQTSSLIYDKVIILLLILVSISIVLLIILLFVTSRRIYRKRKILKKR